MDRIKKIKINREDGVTTDYMRIGVNATEVDLDDGRTAQDVFNTMPIRKAVRTEERPLYDENAAGTMIFDVTLNKPIWWNGSQWVDANGGDI